MLIYEKNNKLNINFDNEISENPDVQIGKDGDKTEVLVDGSSNPTIPVPVLPEDVGKAIVVNEDGSYALANAGGGGSEPFVVTFSGTTAGGDAACDKTLEQIAEAYNAGKAIFAKYNKIEDHHGVMVEKDFQLSNLWIDKKGWLSGTNCYISWGTDSALIESVLECSISYDAFASRTLVIVKFNNL